MNLKFLSIHLRLCPQLCNICGLVKYIVMQIPIFEQQPALTYFHPHPEFCYIHLLTFKYVAVLFTEQYFQQQ